MKNYNFHIYKSAFILAIVIVCFLKTNVGFSQNSKIDSILKSVDTITSVEKRVRTLTTLAGQKRYTKSTRVYINKAITIANKQKSSMLLAHSYYSLGNFYMYNSKVDSSLVILDKALMLVSKNKDEILKASIITSKGGAYKKLSANVLAISTYIEALNILNTIDTSTLSNDEILKVKGKSLVIKNSLANLYSSTEDYEKALDYYDQAYKAVLSLDPNAPNAAIILGNKGNLLIKMNQPEKGLEIIQKSRALKLKSNLPPRFIATSDLSIGLAYFEMGNYPAALVNFDKALETYQKSNYAYGIMQTLIERGQLHLQTKQFKKAKADCEQGKKMALNQNDSEQLIKASNCLYKVEKELNNTAASLKNFEQYNKLKDSVFNEKNIRKITQIEMQYNFDKKEAEQQLSIEKEKRTKNLFLLGLIASVIIAFGIIIFFRKRIKYQNTITQQKEELHQQKIIDLKQKNKLTSLSSMLEGQEAERLRIAKDLHDSLGGLLSTVKSHFTSITNEKEKDLKEKLTLKTNELIDEACIEVRRISHNMMPHSLSISGLKAAVNDISEHLTENGYKTTFEVNNLPKLNETTQITIYRLIQEIVSNIRKHANANTVLIQLFGYKNELNITIEDNGKGFDFNLAMKKNGLGLKSINSRVDYLDGTIDWDSQLNTGTTINISIPIKN